MPNILDLARAYKAQLERQDEEALSRLVSAYRLMWDRLEGRIDALLLQIEKDGVTSGKVFRLERYKSLMSQLEAEMERYSSYLTTELEMSTEQSMRLGLAHSNRLTSALLQEAGIKAALQNLPTNAVKTLLGFLQEGSPLYDRIGALTGVQAQRVRDALIEGMGLGYGPRETARMIQDAFGQGLTDALRMTRTADLYAYREAARANYNANSDIVSGWMWWAELDGDTCAVCISEHGSIHGLDETLDGHYNCVLPDTTVRTLSSPAAAIARRYDGKAVRLETASGQLLSVTPNHPILTRRGWVAAQDLQLSDYVIRYGGAEGAASAVNPNQDHSPSSVEDITLSLRMLGVSTVPSSPHDFHGDGRDGQIHVIRPDSPLGREIFAPFLEPLSQQYLGGGNLELWMSLAPNSHLYAGGERFGLTSDGVMSRLGIGLILGGAPLTHHQPVRFNLAPKHYVLSDQEAAYYATINPEAFSEGFLAVPALIQGGNLYFGKLVPDRVVSLTSFDYSGHVYNLETENGWYISNRIITHNCRCAMVPYIEGMSEEAQSGSDWFDMQSEQTQKGTLGESKWQAWKEGKFTLGDLVDRAQDDTYGWMVREKALKELVSE